MAAATEYASPPGFSRSSSLSITHSPDTASPLYPERAIRPLPKSRLKSKLSPEQVSAIIYPPDPPPVSPTLSFRGEPENAGGGNRQRRMTNGDGGRGGYVHQHPHRQHHHHDALVHDHCTCGEEADSGDEEVEFDHPDYRYLSDQYRHSPNGVGANRVLDNVQRRLMEAARVPAKPPPPASTASSADGYESFENTSNKKKRKIPLSAASSMHQSQLSAEMASMGISGGSMDGAVDDGHGGGGVAVQQPHALPPAAANLGTRISGAGRGRYGRQSGRNDHGMRRPLGNSSMSAVNGSSSRLPARSGSEVANGVDIGIENTNTGGIISQAIKTAAEQGPLTPQRGQENASLLQSATSTASTPASTKTQFTFAVESESANKMVDQQAAVAAAQASYASNARSANGQAVPAGGGKYTSTQGTQTTPSLRASNTGGSAARGPPNSALPSDQQQAQPAPKPKPRRRPSKEYALAARQRRLQQEYANYHHRPTKENMWICEFCEYEDIFGVPPVALIRQYEIKDRQERKRAAEKRRLLEKAKAKNRKGKKGGKKGNSAASAHNNSSVAAAPAPPGGAGGQAYDPNLPPPEGEEYYDDEEEEYGDEYEPVGGPGADDQYQPAGYYPPPPPAPVSNPQAVGAGGGKHHPG